MTGQVEGKVALVTGGASGIGAAIAELLAQEGATVVTTDIDELMGPDVATRINKAGRKAIFLPQDVTSEARWAEVVGDIERRFGRLDVLVSNAGIGIGTPSIVDMTLEDWRRQTAINLDGVFLSVKYCLPLMRKTGGGSVIMMSSLAGLRGWLLRDQGGRPPVRQGGGDGMRVLWRRHPRQLRASRHHRYADLGQDSRWSWRERPDRSGGARQTRNAAGTSGAGDGNRAGRVVPGLRTRRVM
jgi:NAD(P)-dependent dehydrogenase (short-subunit alcohol dehydrogenase family)